jgi:hypothetical protein
MKAIVVTDQAAGLETIATIQKAIATLAVFIIEPGAPRRLHPARLTRSAPVISRPARPGGNNEERRPTYRQIEKAHEASAGDSA